MALLRGVFGAFQRCMVQRPKTTAVANTTVLWVVSDSLSQYVAPDRETGDTKQGHNWARTARMVSFGAFLYAVPAMKWYDALLNRWFPSASLGSVAAKVGLDQAVQAPLTTASLFVVTSLLEGKGLEGAKHKVEERLMPTLRVNWCIWPFIQAINLRAWCLRPFGCWWSTPRACPGWSSCPG
ncbi:unnamed protein product [Effrenium voratum]|nr:unnamed protein product [Effrenium voratum]